MRDFSGTGFMVSEIGVGTYYDPGWIVRARLFGSRPNRDMKVKAISTALECGVNMIDTAEIYQSEDMVAEALGGAGTGPRCSWPQRSGHRTTGGRGSSSP